MQKFQFKKIDRVSGEYNKQRNCTKVPRIAISNHDNQESWKSTKLYIIYRKKLIRNKIPSNYNSKNNFFLSYLHSCLHYEQDYEK